MISTKAAGKSCRGKLYLFYSNVEPHETHEEKDCLPIGAS